MKRIACCLSLLALVTLLAAGCEPRYYHETSSETLLEESLEDSVPPYVFGEKGFYDTAADAEYLLVADLRAKKIGEEVFSADGRTFYKVEGLHESYFLADGDGNVYKNASLPWTVEPGEDGWEAAYPALEWVRHAN